MFIIADSGGTKTAWRAVYENGRIEAAMTEGLNPTGLDKDTIQEAVRKAIPELNPEGRLVDEIFFYGAGLISPESAAPIASVLETWCPMASLHFHSDLLAAARALFGNENGVVAIMGTGSNSCLYENGEIVRNIHPGGFILGDEGSGASLGRAFLADFIKGMLPPAIEKDFMKEYGLDYHKIVHKVYKEPAASAFLASLAPFILRHKEDRHINEMIRSSLEAFVRRSLSRYGRTDIGVAGSFGCACREFLCDIGKAHDLNFIKFIESPIDGLVKHHLYGI